MSLQKFLSGCRRITQAMTMGVGSLLLASGAQAADPAHGMTVYQTYCSGCHLADPKLNANKILNGANNTTRIQTAIDGNTGGMGFLKTLVLPADVADLAAYLGTFVSAPGATVAPSSLSFAGQTTGTTSAAQTLTLTNSGTAALSLSAISASSPEFPLAGGTCVAPSSVAAGASCTVSVKFAPTATGTRSGNMTLTHNATGGSTVVGLTGTGQAPATPAVAVSPTSLSFTQTVGTTSAAKLVTVSNTGNAPLLLNGLSVTGTNANDFAIAAGGTCAVGGSVAAGANCTIALSFTPAAASARSASLSIAHNATATPTTVALSGTGTSAPQAVIALNKNALTFTSQALSTTSGAQTVTLSNTGTAPLTLQALTLGGSNAAEFKLGGTCAVGGTLAAAGTCSLQFSFTPTAIGTRMASLAIVSDASNGTATINLTGTGAAASAPAVTLSPLAVDFGNVTVGSAAATRAVTLTNSGTAALSLGGISASGSGFAATSACGNSLAAGASCNVTVSFVPAAASAFTGELSVSSNAAGSPHAIALTGAGVLPSLPVMAWSTTATTLSFADTLVGSKSAAKTLTLTNKGPGNVTLDAIAVQGAMAAEFPLAGTCTTGLNLASGATCSVLVAFSPAQMGLRTGSLSVTSNGTNPVAVALSGNGVAQAATELSASVTALHFRDTAVGSRSSALPVILHNTGTRTITIKSTSVSSRNFQRYMDREDVVLRPGDEMELKVWFTPSTTGALTASLSITSNASNSPLTIALTGTGVNRSHRGDKPNETH